MAGYTDGVDSLLLPVVHSIETNCPVLYDQIKATKYGYIGTAGDESV